MCGASPDPTRLGWLSAPLITSDITLKQTGAVTKQSWSQVPKRLGDDGWVEASPNGWGALAVWAAGPENTCRMKAAAGERHAELLLDGAAGQVRQLSMLGEEDLAAVDDDIDTYLAAAGVPPMPRGQVWFIRMPAQCASPAAFWEVLGRRIEDSDPGTGNPWIYRMLMEEVLADLYNGPTSLVRPPAGATG